MSEPRRILVIDDDHGIREVAQASLELVGGHTVTTVGSGQEGLDAVRRDPPDAVLLDVMMPGMDGPTTFTLLQDDPRTRDVPVVLLTAKVQQSDRSRFAELGVAGVVAKPFDPLTLSDRVADILGWNL